MVHPVDGLAGKVTVNAPPVVSARINELHDAVCTPVLTSGNAFPPSPPENDHPKHPGETSSKTSTAKKEVFIFDMGYLLKSRLLLFLNADIPFHRAGSCLITVETYFELSIEHDRTGVYSRITAWS
jgi:hypothetical protein